MPGHTPHWLAAWTHSGALIVSACRRLALSMHDCDPGAHVFCWPRSKNTVCSITSAKYLLDGWHVEQLPKGEDARLCSDFLYEINQCSAPRTLCKQNVAF